MKLVVSSAWSRSVNQTKPEEFCEGCRHYPSDGPKPGWTTPKS